MEPEIEYPFNPGDVVMLNSSPDVLMTVDECFKSGLDYRNGKPIFSVNVAYLDKNGRPLKSGFPHHLLSIYKSVKKP